MNPNQRPRGLLSPGLDGCMQCGLPQWMREPHSCPECAIECPPLLPVARCVLCEQEHRSGGAVCGICRAELLAEVDECWSEFRSHAEYSAALSWAWNL